jgi:hypothetical protein
MLVLPGSPLTYDGKRIYGLPQTHDPNGTCYFGPQKVEVTAQQVDGGCIVIAFPASHIARHGELSQVSRGRRRLMPRFLTGMRPRFTTCH